MAPISHSKFDQFTSWNGEDIRDVSRNKMTQFANEDSIDSVYSHLHSPKNIN